MNVLNNVRYEINRITAVEDSILEFHPGVRLMAECMDEDDGNLVDGGKN